MAIACHMGRSRLSVSVASTRDPGTRRCMLTRNRPLFASCRINNHVPFPPRRSDDRLRVCLHGAGPSLQGPAVQGHDGRGRQGLRRWRGHPRPGADRGRPQRPQGKPRCLLSNGCDEQPGDVPWSQRPLAWTASDDSAIFFALPCLQGKQQAIHKAESFAEYLAKRKAAN